VISAEFDLVVKPGTLHRSDMGTITGQVWACLGEEQFPEPNWSDLIVGFLSGFVAAVSEAERTSQPQVAPFLDGPFELRIEPSTPTNWKVSAHERANPKAEAAVTVSADTVKRSLAQAARTIASECRRRGWSSRELDSLARASNLRVD